MVLERLQETTCPLECASVEDRPKAIDNLRELVRELLAVIDAKRDLLVSRTNSPELVGRQLAAGGLARCRALLEGIVLLVDGGRDDVAGVLLRTLYETHLVALYVLLGGPKASVEVMGDYVRSARLLAKTQGRPSTDPVLLWEMMSKAEGGPPASPLHYEQIANKVGDALERVKDPRGGRERAAEQYNSVYRVESQINAHAGLGSLGRYVDWRADPYATRGRPGDLAIEAEDRVVLGALMTALVAEYVLREFGLRADIPERLWAQLNALPEAP